MAVKRSFLRLRFSAFKWSFSSGEKNEIITVMTSNVVSKGKRIVKLWKNSKSRGLQDYNDRNFMNLQLKFHQWRIIPRTSSPKKVLVTIPASLWRDTLVGFPFVPFEIVLFLGLPKRQHNNLSLKIVCKMTHWSSNKVSPLTINDARRILNNNSNNNTNNNNNNNNNNTRSSQFWSTCCVYVWCNA